MKRIAMFMSALALAFTFASCDKGGKDPIDLDNVTEDGFYLAGPATGASAISAEYMMTAGVNEVLMDPEGEYKLSWSESKRAGMYEKYIVLEGGVRISNSFFTLMVSRFAIAQSWLTMTQKSLRITQQQTTECLREVLL